MYVVMYTINTWKNVLLLDETKMEPFGLCVCNR